MALDPLTVPLRWRPALSRQMLEERARIEAVQREKKLYADLSTRIEGLTPRVAAIAKDAPSVIDHWCPVNL